MTEKEVEKHEIEEKEVSVKKTKHLESAGDKNSEITRVKSRKWMIWSIVGASGVLLIIVSGAIVFHNARERAMEDRFDGHDIHIIGGSYGNRGGYQSGSFYSQSSETDGPTITTTTVKRTYTQGVVKSVSNGKVVVVGNGQEETIITNDDTTYDDDTKPAVNDTVIIVGTVGDDDRITANRISVANN